MTATVSSPAKLVVTALRESPRAPGRYAVTVSDGRSFLVGVSALAEIGATRIGAQLDAEGIAFLSREASISDLVARAVGMLARGRRTRRELEQRLRRKAPEPTLIAAALDRLEAAGVLSDQEVAMAEASARLRRGEAPTRVRMTLRSKGIPDRQAKDAVHHAIDESGFDERSACLALATKRQRALASLEPAVAHRRLMDFLQRRGFSSAVVRDVMAELRRSSSHD